MEDEAEGASVYLSGLLAGRLVLGSLTQIFDSLVFREEVLLLRHFLPLHTLVQQLPVYKPNTGRLELSAPDDIYSECKNLNPEHKTANLTCSAQCMMGKVGLCLSTHLFKVFVLKDICQSSISTCFYVARLLLVSVALIDFLRLDQYRNILSSSN